MASASVGSVTQSFKTVSIGKGRGIQHTDFEHAVSEIIKDATALHNHDARSDLVRFVSLGKFLDGLNPKSMHAHGAHCAVTTAAAAAASIVARRAKAERLRRHSGVAACHPNSASASLRVGGRALCRANGQFGSFVYQTADGDDGAEHAGIDGRRARPA